MRDADIEYIHELEERVQELERELKYEKQALINQERAADREIERQREQNQRFTIALEKIRKEGQFKNLQTGRESYNFQARLANQALGIEE